MVLASEQFGIGNEVNCITGADLASAATIAPTHKIHVVTGAVEITTITPPNSGQFGGDIVLIAGPTATDQVRVGIGGNILAAAAVPSGEAMVLTFNQRTQKWIPRSSQYKRVVNLAAATQALTAAQSGQKFVGAVDAVFTLPASSAALKGVWYEFECGALSVGTGLSISPAAADAIGGNGLTAVVDKDLINSGATDRLGDMVRIYCTGETGAAAWRIEAIIGTWAKE